MKVDLGRHRSQILVVHCSDPRFQAAYRQLIDDLGQYYDLLVFPGASKAIVDHQVVMDNIRLLHDLHGFETVHIFDHVECGAFGPVADEATAHQATLAEAQAALEKVFGGIEVVGHLVGQAGEIKF